MASNSMGIHGEDPAVISEQQIEKMSEVHNFNISELDSLKILHQASSSKTSLKVFRELRTQLYAHARGRNFVCLVTSVCSGGGASYVASNVAAAITLDRSKSAILVDCNFDSPGLDGLLSAEANLGLTDYLSVKDMGIEFILYASGIRRLRIIPSGENVGSATENISSTKMRGFIHELKTRYHDRYTIMDAPSIGESSADVSMLAELSDFVILVVPYGKVSSMEVNDAIDKIGKHRIAGVLFNNV